ncbi:MAG: UvrB/UvrC motif-containing protein [Planctomycetota bacterium]
MKCQYCEKPATFHITELTGEQGPQILHLCEDHARQFLKNGNGNAGAASSITGALAQTLKLSTAKDELAETDQKACPVCGITFFEFRNTGRLGCPNDYDFFKSDLLPLLKNIHDAQRHVGKRPRRAAAMADQHENLVALRREMQDAIGREDYERAGQIRDQLQQIEANLNDDGEPS